MTRPLRLVAVGLIVLGAVVIAGSTLGFSAIASDRGVHVSAADPSNGLVSITAEGDEVDHQQQSTDIASVTDNSDMDIDIVEISVEGYDEALLEIDGIEDQTISAVCDDPHSYGYTDVSIVVNAEGNGISITEATKTIEDIHVSCGDEDDFEPDTEFAYSEGPERVGQGVNEDITFEIESELEESVTITAFEVREAGDETGFNEYEIGEDEHSGEGYDIGERVEHESFEIESGGTIQYRLNGFSDNMNNENFEFIIYDIYGVEYELPPENIG